MVATSVGGQNGLYLYQFYSHARKRTDPPFLHLGLAIVPEGKIQPRGLLVTAGWLLGSSLNAVTFPSELPLPPSASDGCRSEHIGLAYPQKGSLEPQISEYGAGAA